MKKTLMMLAVLVAMAAAHLGTMVYGASLDDGRGQITAPNRTASVER